MTTKASKSENNGIAALSDDDLNVYSIGISTGGVAEIRMAKQNAKRHIIATTIDEAGIDFANKYIAQEQLERQIETKLEDITKPLPYNDAYFDFIYARLVLHYLAKQDLEKALKELYRILKPGGKLFVVVRSVECTDANLKAEDVRYEEATGLTIKTVRDKNTGKQHEFGRFYHTESSIRRYTSQAGFTVKYVKSYDEQLYVDFMRTKLAPHTDNVIELLAVKDV